MNYLLLTDWRLSAYVDGERVYSEPAVVLESSELLSFGVEAQAQARIHPRHTNAEFLGKLNADPLTQPFARARNHADLLYLQLKHLCDSFTSLTDSPTLMIVPSGTTTDQLGLLLGVSQEAGLQVASFIDLAALSVAATGTLNSSQFFELTLAGCHGAWVEVDGFAHARDQRERRDASLTRLIDGWANAIADQFVASSRFDPLHAATTEQQLYNAIYDWFAHGRVDAGITIEHNGERRQLEINMAPLADPLEQLIEAATSDIDRRSPILLGCNAASTPLLADALASSGLRTTGSHMDILAAYLAEQEDWFASIDSVQLITEVPLAAQSQNLATPTPAPSPPPSPTVDEPAVPEAQTSAAAPGETTVLHHEPGTPTHGLHVTRAYRIGSTELPAGLVAGLPCGATVEVDGLLFTLIEVR